MIYASIFLLVFNRITRDGNKLETEANGGEKKRKPYVPCVCVLVSVSWLPLEWHLSSLLHASVASEQIWPFFSLCVWLGVLCCKRVFVCCFSLMNAIYVSVCAYKSTNTYINNCITTYFSRCWEFSFAVRVESLVTRDKTVILWW